MLKRVSLVIPSFNEEESLPILLERSRKVFESQQLAYEIFVIDDGSTDKTISIVDHARDLDPNIHIVSFRRNFGKAIALTEGFKRSTGDIVIMMDADLQDDPDDIPKLIAKLDEGYDVVTGWKFERHDPWHKILPSHVINWIVRKVYGLSIHDMNCGLKAFRKEVLDEIQLYGDLYRYMLIFAHAKGFRVTELPTRHHARKFGKSKYGFSRIFRGFSDLLTVYFLTKYAKRPLHFFGGVGATSSVIGFLILVYLSVEKIYGIPIGNRPLFFLGILLVIIGIQLFVTGFIAELLIAQQPAQRPTMKKEN